MCVCVCVEAQCKADPKLSKHLTYQEEKMLGSTEQTAV